MNAKLIGHWQCDQEDSRARIEVRVDDEGAPAVHAYDSVDGEVFDVLNLKVGESIIEFDTVVPSNWYRNHIRLWANEDGSCSVEFTHLERWVICKPGA